MEIFDNGDNANDLLWGDAAAKWVSGDPDKLAELLLDKSCDVPELAREFLADVIAGHINKGRGGRPSERDEWVKRSILAEVFTEWEQAEQKQRLQGESPKNEAYEIVANRRNESSGAIRGVCQGLTKMGITREQWIAWGRPNWKRNT